jgi:hypothetical protein
MLEVDLVVLTGLLCLFPGTAGAGLSRLIVGGEASVSDLTTMTEVR